MNVPFWELKSNVFYRKWMWMWANAHLSPLCQGAQRQKWLVRRTSSFTLIWISSFLEETQPMLAWAMDQLFLRGMIGVCGARFDALIRLWPWYWPSIGTPSLISSPSPSRWLNMLSQPNSTSTPVGLAHTTPPTETFKALPDNLGGWFLVCKI